VEPFLRSAERLLGGQVVLGSRDSRVGRHEPEEFSLEDAPGLRREHRGPTERDAPPAAGTQWPSKHRAMVTTQ